MRFWRYYLLREAGRDSNNRTASTGLKHYSRLAFEPPAHTRAPPFGASREPNVTAKLKQASRHGVLALSAHVPFVSLAHSPLVAFELPLHHQQLAQLVSLRVPAVYGSAPGVALVLGARKEPRAVVKDVLHCCRVISRVLFGQDSASIRPQRSLTGEGDACRGGGAHDCQTLL